MLTWTRLTASAKTEAYVLSIFGKSSESFRLLDSGLGRGKKFLNSLNEQFALMKGFV